MNQHNYRLTSNMEIEEYTNLRSGEKKIYGHTK